MKKLIVQIVATVDFDFDELTETPDDILKCIKKDNMFVDLTTARKLKLTIINSSTDIY